MHITLIGNTAGYSSQRLKEEAEKLGVAFLMVPIDSVVLSVQKNEFLLFNEQNASLMDSDCYIFRGIGEADQEVMVMAKYLLKKGATVIEEIAANGALLMDKLFFGTVEQDVPAINYFMIQGKRTLQVMKSALTYPLVMKSTVGSMGRKVYLINNESELDYAFDELGPRIILQEYLPVNHDYRALVIGGEYIGAYRRKRFDGEFRMNRPGNQKEPATLPPDVVGLCKRAARQQNIGVAGIDLINHNDSWYVLEINASPAFKQFELVTGHNVAKKIIQYAILKTGK